MKLALPPDSTSVSLLVFLQDATALDGAGLTGLAYNTGSLTAYYARAGAAAVQINLATQTAAGAYSSGGFVAVDGTNMPGVYRLDIPDNALLSGTPSVMVIIKGATNLVPKTIEIQLASVPAAVASLASAVITSASLSAGALTAIAGSILSTAANKLVTDASGNVSLATGGIGANQVSAAAAAKITDIFMRRALGDIRASANGDPVTINSALGALARLANKFEFIDDATMRVYAEDGTTPFIDITVYRDTTGITGMTPEAA